MAESQTLPLEGANQLVEEHRGWAESIARSVARSWNLDWQLDGLDGAAMEALIFCSRRFEPGRGISFKGYARKRIHEASAEAARKSRGWKSSSKAQNQAREISFELCNVFPELRSGHLPSSDDADGARGGIRQLLMGATIIAAREGLAGAMPDEALDYKRMFELLASMEPLHQELLWKLYWEGLSMRGLATEWETDELNVIREHKTILTFLQKGFAKGKNKSAGAVKIRPGLKHIALKFKKKKEAARFAQFLRNEVPL